MKATKRDLIGRKIVAVDFQPFLARDSPSREIAYRPVLTLDNGRRVWFTTAETDFDDYGTTICISPKPARPAKPLVP